ncbi:MAG: efflux RND transporter periplasmic adaptor subunit [Planctomycetaceae bacterium]
MSRGPNRRLVACGLMLAGYLTGCQKKQEQLPKPPPPKVQVSQVVQRTVTDFVDYTGQTVAVAEVAVRSRVTGYLNKVTFRDGDIVKQDQLLYEIDPRPYQAAVNQAEGQVQQATAGVEQAIAQKGVSEAAKSTRDAELTLAQENFDRTSKLAAQGASTSQDLDLRRSQLDTAKANIISAASDLQLATARIDVAKASLTSAQAALESAKLNLEFTTLTAPISGRIGKTALTEGNLVQSADAGLGMELTSIVTINPIYVDFDADEATILRIRTMIREGKADRVVDGNVKAFFGLVNEPGFPHEGLVTFFDNKVNSNTGTLAVRGTFDTGDEEIQPGFYARVRVPVGRPYEAVLINERAVSTDLGLKIVYVVDAEGLVTARPVVLGQLHDGLQVVSDGLQGDERIVVNGLQRVATGVRVDPELVPMPSNRTAAATGGEATAANGKTQVSASDSDANATGGKDTAGHAESESSTTPADVPDGSNKSSR